MSDPTVLQLATIIAGVVIAVFGRQKLEKIHTLVNSQMTDALDHIKRLEQRLTEVGQRSDDLDSPPAPGAAQPGPGGPLPGPTPNPAPLPPSGPS